MYSNEIAVHLHKIQLQAEGFKSWSPLPRCHQKVPKRPNPLPFAEGAQEFHWSLASSVSWQCAHARPRCHSQMASCFSPGDGKWQWYIKVTRIYVVWRYRSKIPKAKGCRCSNLFEGNLTLANLNQTHVALQRINIPPPKKKHHPTTRKYHHGACLAWNSRKLLCDHERSQSTGWPMGAELGISCTGHTLRFRVQYISLGKHVHIRIVQMNTAHV